MASTRRRSRAAAWCIRPWLCPPEDQRRAGMAVAERAARAVDERDTAVAHLALSALAAQLLDGLDDEEDSAHAGMVRRQPAAIGVDRQLAAERDTAARHACAALAFLAAADILQP